MIHTDLFTFPKDIIRIFVSYNDKPGYEKRVLHVKAIPPPRRGEAFNGSTLLLIGTKAQGYIFSHSSSASFAIFASAVVTLTWYPIF